MDIKNSKGFNLIELMIVVAIIGILAAVAIPAYMTYIQKSKLASLVYPGMHSIQTNISLIFATQLRFPSTVALVMGEADTTYFSPSLLATGNGALQIVIQGGGPTGELSKLDGGTIRTAPNVGADGQISGWVVSGTLGIKLGL